MLSILTDEPALITGMVTAVLVLLVTFGVPISDEQQKAILGLFSAALMLSGALYVRSKVTPTAKLAPAAPAAPATPTPTDPTPNG